MTHSVLITVKVEQWCTGGGRGWASVSHTEVGCCMEGKSTLLFRDPGTLDVKTDPELLQH